MASLSIVVPVCNEQGSVKKLHAEIVAALKPLAYDSEILFVNDGSTDGTLAALKDLKGIIVIDLNRNYGQATALDAGFKAATGDIIVSLDGDGQNDPRDIPLLIRTLESGKFDVVAGWRKNRKDPADIRLLTRIGRQLRRAFIGDPVHDSGCTLRAYTGEAAKSLDIGGEMHRYILALLRWKGFRIAEVEVSHRERFAGESKYSSHKSVRGFIDLLYIWFIYKYSQRPLHLFGYFSLFSFFFGVLAGLWTLYNSIYLGIHFARDVWVVVTFFFFLAGMLFFCFGIVIDLLIRIHLNVSPYERRYYIRDTIRT